MKRSILLSLLLASTAVAEQTNYVSVTPVVDTSAYATKDSVGGVQALSLISCNNQRRGKITSVVLSDKSGNAVEYNILTFRTNPAGTFNDQGAVDPTDADLLSMNPVINIASTDCFTFNDNGVCSLSSLRSNVVSSVTSSLPGTLYVVIQAIGTPTYASASDVTLTVGFTCDN